MEDYRNWWDCLKCQDWNLSLRGDAVRLDIDIFIRSHKEESGIEIKEEIWHFYVKKGG